MNIFFGVMTTVPVVLKLTGYVDWSWQLILAPIVCPLAVLGLMYLMALVFRKKDGPQTQTTRRIIKTPVINKTEV